MRLRLYIISAGIVGLCLIISASFAQAAVRINEIAWMGSVVSHNHQFIELHNTSAESVSLEGWRLVSVGSTPQIDLEGEIEAGGFFLLERTSDESVPDVPADMIYTGSLRNAGEHLRLLDGNDVVIDEINNASGWIAGDNDTKETMQRTSTGWITAEPTPGAVNHTAGTQPENNNNNEDSSVDSLADTESLTKTLQTKHNIKVTAPPPPDYTAQFTIPTYGYIGVPLSFQAEVYKYGDKRLRGQYRWVMGDGNEYFLYPRTVDDLSFVHTYAYPGTYIISLEYRTNSFEGSDPVLVQQRTITIREHGIHITNINGDGSVSLENTTGEIIDISGWFIGNASTHIPFQDYTMIAPASTLVFTHDALRSMSTQYSSITLFTPSGSAVSNFDHPLIAHPSHRYTPINDSFSSASTRVENSGYTEPSRVSSNEVMAHQEESQFVTLSGRVIYEPEIQPHASHITEKLPTTSMPWVRIRTILIIGVGSLLGIILAIFLYILSKKLRFTTFSG